MCKKSKQFSNDELSNFLTLNPGQESDDYLRRKLDLGIILRSMCFGTFVFQECHKLLTKVAIAPRSVSNTLKLKNLRYGQSYPKSLKLIFKD